MKIISFFGYDVTRVILGDNPFNGHSYIQDRITGDEMKTYYTKERVLETLFKAEKLGINTMLPLACPKILELLPEYYDKGGSMKIIFQPYPAEPIEENLEKMMEFNPIGIYHQGTTTDYLNETSQKETIIKNMKIYKSAGVPVGVCSHVPETIMQCEEEDWGADFYMTCLYNARRNRRGEQSGFITGKSKADLIFYPDDRFLMYKVIQNLKKPCIAFKVFAGGQIFSSKREDEYEATAEAMLREVYTNIKPGDIVAIGVFQRDRDLLKRNIEMVNKILSC
jgi:hypothetical protein